jgi:hypothetical protein
MGISCEDAAPEKETPRSTDSVIPPIPPRR